MSRFQDLEIFSRVVAMRSMSAAAKEMGCSPAVISKRLQALEKRLGTRLLNRTTRQISLTEAGEGYYERVIDILAGLEEAEAFVTRRSSSAQGILKISAPTTFGRVHIAPHLVKFMRANPQLRVDLNLSDSFVDIISAGLDLAIRIGDLPDSSLVARRLAPVKRILCASPRYLRKHGTPQTLEELTGHELIAPHFQGHWKLEGPDGEVVMRPNSNLLTNSSEVIRETVIAGLGIALRSTWDISDELKKGRLVHVLDAYSGSKGLGIHAIFPSRTYLPLKVRLFVDYFAELFGPTPYWDHGLDLGNRYPVNARVIHETKEEP